MKTYHNHDDVAAHHKLLEEKKHEFSRQKRQLPKEEAEDLDLLSGYVDTAADRQKLVDKHADAIAEAETYPGEMQGIIGYLFACMLESKTGKADKK